ncbi:MAG: copper amine oxidase N-terminal domain-containing protein [Clostridiales bacterium]|nr:copper amine oxidase N-terminal domain-containing protein [Clostridiales bacterium]
MITKKNKYDIKTKKRIKNVIYPFLIMLFAILGTACIQQRALPAESSNISQGITGNVNNGSDTNSLNSPKPVNNNTQITYEKVNIEEHNYVLSLIADNDEALLNGESVILPTPPFIQNGTFYIPLEAVTKLLGGTYSFENDIATIQLFGNTTKYQIGSHSIIINGETYVLSGQRYYFTKEGSGDYVIIDEKYVPMVSDGIVFIPVNYETADSPYNGINAAREYPESRMVILADFKNERGINEVKLNDSYDNLPANFRSQLHYTGIVGEVINYSIEEYKNDDLKVYVMRVNKPHDDVEGMDGKVCAIRENFTSGNRYSTPRGLKTGDSAYRAWRLYGYESFTNSFFYKVEGGIVSSFTFYTRYYGSQL